MIPLILGVPFIVVIGWSIVKYFTQGPSADMQVSYYYSFPYTLKRKFITSSIAFLYSMVNV